MVYTEDLGFGNPLFGSWILEQAPIPCCRKSLYSSDYSYWAASIPVFPLEFSFISLSGQAPGRDTKWILKHLSSPLFLRSPIFHPLEEPSDFSPSPLPPLAGWDILTGVNGGLKPKDETLIALQPSTPELGTVYGGWQIFPNGPGITPSRNRHNS